VLAKSFKAICLQGFTHGVRVQVNEFHQFFCDYSNSTLDAHSENFRLALELEDATPLVIADTTKIVF